MRKLILTIGIILLSVISYGQDINNESKIRDRIEMEIISKVKYLDPSYPINGTEHEIGKYISKHPHAPLRMTLTVKEWEKSLYSWYEENPYYPRFIEYHKFDKTLNFENSVFFYKIAKEQWIKHNKIKN